MRRKVRELVLEEGESVGEGLDRVDKVYIDEDVHVELLVSPVYLEEGLEAGQEHVRLVIGRVHQFFNLSIGRLLNRVLLDPLPWVKGGGLLSVLAPIVTDLIIPGFEGIGVVDQVDVLAPAFEALDSRETF